MKRLVPVALALFAALLWASPAGAHEEIEPAIFPTGKPTFFTLNAANEKQVDLNKITLTAPANLPFGETTHEPAGWTVAKSEKVLTWTGGAVKPEQFETWGFEIEGADQPGPLTYKVTLGFTDGSSEDANVVVNAVAPDTTPTTAGTASTAPTTAGTPSTAANHRRHRIHHVEGVGHELEPRPSQPRPRARCRGAGGRRVGDRREPDPSTQQPATHHRCVDGNRCASDHRHPGLVTP